jgi:DNA-binding transcriptional LysR family regulator
MWLPNLLEAVITGDIDVALTCGVVPEPVGVASEVFCAEPLLVGLRPSHRLASRDTIALSELAHEVLGTAPQALFPAWAMTQRQALDTAGIAPPTIELADTDLAAICWADQPDIDWILLIPSLATARAQTVIRPVAPASSCHSPCNGTPAGRTLWPLADSSTVRWRRISRPAGIPSLITCTTPNQTRTRTTLTPSQQHD